jgi:asparagine synthase (glutamine-hydrolysing)
MTDWAVAIGDGGREGLDELLSPVLRALGSEAPRRDRQGARIDRAGAGFRVGARAARPPRSLLAHDPHVVALFDGRLENRAELAASLGADGSELTDAEIVLALWRRSGEPALGRLRGPFAAVVWEPGPQRLVLARDVLGDRSLSYSWARHRGAPFLVAPDAASLLAVPGIRSDWNERSIARFFAVEAPIEGDTYFAAIEEVPRGHVVSWTAAGGIHMRRFDRLEPDWRARTERQPVERLRELLTEAVRCDLARPGQTGILLSGGLDSAAIASRAAALTSAAERPAAITWVFDELSAGEPIATLTGLVEALGLPWHPIPADHLWPLGGDDWTVEGSFPSADLYQRPLRESLRVASERGLSVLLNGQYGDQLWVEGAMWLRALLRRGRLDLAAVRLARQWHLERNGGPRRGSARGALRRLLPGGGSAPPSPVWLTTEARDRASLGHPVHGTPRGANAAQWASVNDPFAPLGIHWNRMVAARWGIEMRYPYRHRPLVEWMLALPADRLYSPGGNKLLLRQMLQSEVPPATADRWRAGSLAPLATRGLVERERARVEGLLREPNAVWPRFVRRDWVLDGFVDRFRNDNGAPALIGWFCVCLELWRRELDSRALAA